MQICFQLRENDAILAETFLMLLDCEEGLLTQVHMQRGLSSMYNPNDYLQKPIKCKHHLVGCMDDFSIDWFNSLRCNSVFV